MATLAVRLAGICDRQYTSSGQRNRALPEPHSVSLAWRIQPLKEHEVTRVTQAGTQERPPQVTAPQRPRRRRITRWLMWIAGIALVLLIAAAIAVRYATQHAEPILRKRVIASLEQRFRSPVELGPLHLSISRRVVRVSGEGLRILNLANTDTRRVRPDYEPPMLSVDSFDFTIRTRQLLEPVIHVQTVSVRGMKLFIPPKNDRGPLLPEKKKKRGKPSTSIVVDKILASDALLSIETDKPGKLPLVFIIHDLTLKDVGAGRPFLFDARLVNPKPVGDIHSTGQFGPWNEFDPRETPVSGQYAFTNADLGPIKGIAGTLSSTGNYSGVLGEIGVQGTTDTPNFSLDVSENPVHLKTEFDATVDGTSGDTHLNHVHATFLNTAIDVSGNIVRAIERNQPLSPEVVALKSGHAIDIDASSDHARIEDLLVLGVKTKPPVMRGALSLRAHLAIPPEDVSVSRKIRMQGHFAIRGATFSNQNWQQTLDKLSERASGHPGKANNVDAARIQSQMSGSFHLAHRLLDVRDLVYQVPGATVNLAGKYSLNGDTFDFAGTIRTEATASQMLSGWKKWAAWPFDPLLKKDGAGLEVPVKITGTKSDMKFGVDMGKLKTQIFHRHPDEKQPPAPATPNPEPAPSASPDGRIVGDPGPH